MLERRRKRVLMLDDIVIDTNVFVHGSNPHGQHFSDAGDFLARLLEVETKLCVDEGFDMEEASNRSLIGDEYLRHIRAGMLGYEVLARVFASRRLKVVASSASPAVRKSINRRVGNKRDRTFLFVTMNTDERVLVSHDYADFPQPLRRELADEFDLSVVPAVDCIGLLDVD